jgi:flavin reductase (DIM6/NTAB) family NADH-FMN oxidoreductase RutF
MVISPDPAGPQSDSPLPPQPTGAPGAGEGIATALGRIPSGLFVISWRDGEADRTMLASWVMQAGFTPPSVSVAVAPTRDLLAAIDRGIPFVVNVLGESQRSLLSRFGKPSTPGEDPFAGLDTLRTPGGTAALAAAAGWIECRGTSRAPAGDHVVVVAEVVGGDSGSAGAPLVHVRKNGLRY